MMMMMMMMMMMNCFCGMLADKRCLALFSAGTIVRNPHNRGSPHATGRFWTWAESDFRLTWMKLCSSDKHYTTQPPWVLSQVWASLSITTTPQRHLEHYFCMNSLKFFTLCFYCMPRWEPSKFIETKLQATCFYLI